MKPYFSMILPVYNVEKYLMRCVDSILAQDFTDYEIILVDDGSTDSSASLCDRICAEHTNALVIHKENGGLASARNAALELARGQYVWFVDSDDWISPAALQQLRRATDRSQPDMVKFNHIRVISQAQEPVLSNALPGSYDLQGIASELLQKAWYSAGKYGLSACMHIYRNAFLQENSLRFVSERLVGSEDYLFNLEAMARAKQTVVLRDTLYYYEQRCGSLTQTYKSDLPERYLRLYQELLTRLPEKHHPKAATFYLWHLLRGTCIPNTYYGAQHWDIPTRRKAVGSMLRADSVKAAYRCCDPSGLSRKQKCILWGLTRGAEPLFYWLYMAKPGVKEGKTL